MEEQLIQLLREQNEKGLVLLKQQYGNRIQYIVSHILQDRQDVEECSSDIYLQIWNRFDSYQESKGKLSTWITAISRNMALNHLKRARINTRSFQEKISTAPSPEDLLEQQEQNKILQEAIQSLPLAEQQLFYRKYYYLQTTAQIAAELEVTERSVEGRLYRMRKKLQALLGGELT